MFDFPVKQRKLTTYGRKTSKPDAYSIARDDVSQDRQRQMDAIAWNKNTSSASTERPKKTSFAGRLTKPAPGKPQDTVWDGPSEDDEPIQPLKLKQKSPAKAAALNLGASKHSRPKSVPQHDQSTQEIQVTAGNDKKRKRELMTRAMSGAPRDNIQEADIFEVPMENGRMARRARSTEPSRLAKARAPALAKKEEAAEVFDFTSDDERPITQKKARSVSSKNNESEICDIIMEGKRSVIAKQSRPTRPRESSKPPPPRQGGRTPSLIKRKETNVVDIPVETRSSTVMKPSRLVPKKMKAMDIFDFPSDEESFAPKKMKAAKPKESSRARNSAFDTTNSISVGSRGEPKFSEPLITHKATRRTNGTTTALDSSRQDTLQPPRSPRTLPKPPKALPGVGWHPNLAIHNSPRRLHQGLSAPATLFNMIREDPRSPPPHSRENMARQVTPQLDLDDEMDVDTTPATPSTIRPAASSQTPGQKNLWGQLLAPDLEDSPSDLPIAKLNLRSTRKPPSMARASSDIPQTTFSRRSRLIDSLKASAPIVEDDEDDDDRDTAMELSPESPTVNPMLARPEYHTRSVSTKVTYAQQRTFLEEKNEDAIYDILADELSQQTSGYGSQSQYNMLDESDPEDSQEAAPRGVHDLRVAGAKRRLLDELDHLVDDVQGMAVKTVSARRSALMEVTEKLMDAAIATTFLDSGMEVRLIKSMDNMTDTTFNFLAATTITLLVDSGATLDTLAKIHGSKVFGRIVGLLSIGQDISKVVKERRSNMSKIAQASIVDFRETISKSRIFTGAIPTLLSPQMMAVRCLDSLVRKFREQDSRADLINQDTTEKLLRVAQSSLAHDNINFAILDSVISILEAHTLSRSTGWSLEAVNIFVHILPALFGSVDPALQRCKFLALRLSLNLTNENPVASDIFALPALIGNLVRFIHQQCALLRTKVDSDTHTINIDNTILALGVMINLTEFSDRVRASVMEGGNDLITQAVTIFLKSTELADKADSVEESQTNVAFGYHTFMLGGLCQNEKVRGIVRRQLPGGKLTMLLEEMQEFTNLNQRMDRMRLEGVEGEELEKGHAQRLQALVDTLVALSAH